MSPLLSLLGALVALILFAYVTARRPTPPALVRFRPDAPILDGWVGGVLWPVFGFPWRATSPMAKLELLAGGIRIGPNGRALGLIIPTWEVDWRHIEAVEEATNGISILTEGYRIKFLVLASRATREGILAQIETARAAG